MDKKSFSPIDWSHEKGVAKAVPPATPLRGSGATSSHHLHTKFSILISTIHESSTVLAQRYASSPTHLLRVELLGHVGDLPNMASHVACSVSGMGERFVADKGVIVTYVGG